MNTSQDQPTAAQATSLPYVGPRPFADSEAERRVFFGRDREAQDLLSLVMAERLVLFFAPSGAGKSSLLHARVMPGLRDEGFNVLPATRVGGQVVQELDGRTIDNIYAFNLLRDLDQGRTPPEMLATTTLSSYLQQDHPDAPVDRVLIVDQFEEIFTSFPEQWSKREEFFRQLSQAMADDPHLWVIVAMREDYIAALDPYTRLLPGRLRVRYRMSYMPYKSALDAVKGPASLAGRPFDDDAAERLVNNLRQLTLPEETTDAPLGEYVEPVQLQVVCLQLWQSLQATPGQRITLENLKELGGGAGLATFVTNALAAFYEQKIAEVLPLRLDGVNERQLRDWFSTVLITKDGTRNLIYQSDTETGGLPNGVVLELERRFLLRAETRAGSKWIELVHDRFIDPILQANRTWRSQTPLIDGAERWATARDPGLLLDGAALDEARRQLQEHPGRFGAVERDFVRLSQEAEQERRAVEQRRDEEKRRADRRATRLILTGALAVVAITLSMAGIAVWLARTADSNAAIQAAAAEQAAIAESAAVAAAEQAANAAADAEAARGEAETLTRIIRADQLASNAMLALESRPQTALLLAVEAANIQLAQGEEPSSQAVQGLRDVLGQVGGIPLLGGPGNMQAAAMSGDQRWLAMADDAGVIRLWGLDDLAADPLLLTGHDGPIWSIAFAPDSNILASAGADGSVRLWDMDAPEPEVAILAGHTGNVYTLAFAPDGSQLASAGSDTTVRRWNVASATLLATLEGHSADVNSLAFNLDGSLLASGSSDATVRVWDADDEAAPPVVLVGHASTVNVVAFSPDGAWLASGGADSQVRLWNLADPAASPPPLTGHELDVFAVTFSPDSRWLASADDVGTVRLWQVRDRAQNYILRGHRGNVRGLAFMPTATGQWLASASYDGTVRLWDYRNPESNPVIVRGHDDAIVILATAPDSSRFATVSYDRTLRVWNADQPFAEPNHLLVARARIGELAVGGDGQHIVSSGVDQSFAQIWDLVSRRPLFRLDGHMGAITGLAVSTDGKTILTGGKDSTVRTWRAADGSLQQIYEGHTGTVFAVAISPDGQTVASASDDRTVRLWDAATGAALRVLTGHAGAVMGVAFSPDGATVASVDREPSPDAEGMPRPATLRMWDVATGRELEVLEGPTDGKGLLSVAYQPSGSWLAAGGEDAKVWVWASDALPVGPAQLRRHDSRNEINAVAFSASGETLASAGTDSLVFLWETSDAAAEPGVLRGHRDSVNAVAFDPAGMWVATAGADGTIRRWAVSVEQLIAEACQTAGRNLTVEEWEQYFPAETPYRSTCPELPAATVPTVP